MSLAAARMYDRAAELHEVFDRSFAQAARSEAGTAESLFGMRVGADPYALRPSELSGRFSRAPLDSGDIYRADWSRVRRLRRSSSVRGAVIVPEPRTETRDWHVREILRTEFPRPIIHLASIFEAIGRRVRA
jgi:hypothetical protein